MTHQPPQLLPLPEPDRETGDGLDPCYSVDLVRAYATSAVQAALSSQAPADERAAFEGWLLYCGFDADDLHRDAKDEYRWGPSQERWVAWQARAALQFRQPATPADKWIHAGYFYNAVAHALMDVKAPHEGCAKRLRTVLDELAALMGDKPAAPVAPVAAVPDGFRLVAVKGFDDLMFWLERCESKGHLENCPDLVEPWSNFDYHEVESTPTPPVQPDVQRDAERYRKLVACGAYAASMFKGTSTPWSLATGSTRGANKADLDAAVDALTLTAAQAEGGK